MGEISPSGSYMVAISFSIMCLVSTYLFHDVIEGILIRVPLTPSIGPTLAK